MKTIYKYPLAWLDEQIINLPKDAMILSVVWIRGEICVYALVDTDALETERRTIEIVGTGNPIPPNTEPATRTFLGTVHNENQTLVFHIFEKTWDN